MNRHEQVIFAYLILGVVGFAVALQVNNTLPELAVGAIWGLGFVLIRRYQREN